jgi:hypothetical protein
LSAADAPWVAPPIAPAMCSRVALLADCNNIIYTSCAAHAFRSQTPCGRGLLGVLRLITSPRSPSLERQ